MAVRRPIVIGELLRNAELPTGDTLKVDSLEFGTSGQGTLTASTSTTIKTATATVDNGFGVIAQIAWGTNSAADSTFVTLKAQLQEVRLTGVTGSLKFFDGTSAWDIAYAAKAMVWTQNHVFNAVANFTTGIDGEGAGYITSFSEIDGNTIYCNNRLNLGLIAGDITTPLNGEVWYNNTSGKFRCREGGVSVDLRAAAGSAPGSDTQIVYNGSGVFAASASLTWNGVLMASGEIHTDGANSGFSLDRRDTGVKQWTLYSAAGDLQFYFQVGATEPMTLTSAGALTIKGSLTTNGTTVLISPTTGTSQATTNYNSTGGTAIIGTEDSAGTFFGAAAYSLVIRNIAGKQTEFFDGTTRIKTLVHGGGLVQENKYGAGTWEFAHRSTGEIWFYTDSAAKVPLKIAQLAPTDTLKLTATGIAVVGRISLPGAAGDVSSPANGDLWRNSTTGKMRMQEDGQSYNVRFDPRRETYFFEDFLGRCPTAITPATPNDNKWQLQSIGTGAVVGTVGSGSVAGRPGQWSIGVGTSSTGISALVLSDATPHVCGGGDMEQEWCFTIPTLSDATNRFSVSFGFRDTFAATVVNGVSFLYTDNINSGRPIIRVVNASTTTDTNASTTALVAGTYYRIRMTVNAARTETKLYINDVLEATSTATVPTAVMRQGVNIVKSLGTTTRSVVVDYMWYREVFTTAR